MKDGYVSREEAFAAVHAAAIGFLFLLKQCKGEHMSIEMLKRTWVEIDLDALAENYRQVRSCVNTKTKLCCIIKADAYGHGAVPVGQELEKLHADYFGVSNLEEALQLRNAGIVRPILVLGYTPTSHARTLAEENIAQCVYSLEYARKLSAEAESAGVQVKVHLKIDTGMNRIGFAFQMIDKTESFDEILEVCKLPAFTFEGLFTHFAVADEGMQGYVFTQQQYSCFKELVEALGREGIHFPICHCANSAALLDYPQIHMDMVRPGIILYGLYPSGKLRSHLSLSPVLSLKSVVSHVKTIAPGETVSYGRIYKADSPRKVITIPVGYADGYPRILGERGATVLVGGKRCPIIGRVCMDQLMADATALKQVQPGDIVTLIGKDGGEEILADEVGRFEDTINYEVVCDIGKRVPRVYIKGGKVESVMSQLVP